MTQTIDRSATRLRLLELASAKAEYATDFVDTLLEAAVVFGASDVHLQPRGDRLWVQWRIDGVLQPLGDFPPGAIADVVTRLKVLAELLTYRNDVPQEGRIRKGNMTAEMRVSTFPTVHGERAVVRLFSVREELRELAQLGLPEHTLRELGAAIAATSGATIVVGPAGSGKTTTAYACLREIHTATQGRRSLATIEDPVETLVPEAVQSQVNRAVGFDYGVALRSLLRQDPEVILVGEIRDRETAETVLQASLTGHLVISTFHAGTVVEAGKRLMEMGLETYLLRSGVRFLLCQRLVRKLCSCRIGGGDQEITSSPDPKSRQCKLCDRAGYLGRLLIAEHVSQLEGTLAVTLTTKDEPTEIEAKLAKLGVVSLRESARESVERGLTDWSEVHRVLGIRRSVGSAELGM